MFYNQNRSPGVGQWVRISARAAEELGGVGRGPYKILGECTYQGYIGTFFDIGFGDQYCVNEAHVTVVDDPWAPSAPDNREGWQIRRDENLRKLFQEKDDRNA